MALDPKVLSDIYGDNGVLANPFPTAKEYQPEQIAQGIKIGRAKGIDAMLAADHLPQLHDELDQDHWNAIVKTSPKLAKQMQEPAFAAVAHDDTQNLSALEKTVSFAKNIGRSIPAGLAGFNEGIYGAVQSVADIGSAATGGILPIDLFGGLSDVVNKRRGVEKAIKTGLEKARGQVGPTEGAIYSGVESGVQNLLMLPVALASRNPNLLAGTMAAQTEGQGYGDAIDAGKTPAQALPFAASQGYVEYATEQIPALKLLNGLKAKAPAMQIAKDFLAKEIPGEQVATALQDLNEWAVLNPDKPFTEYLKDRPGAAYQTLVATIVGGGVQVGAGKAIEHTINRFAPRNAAEENAQQDHQTLTQLDQLAAESKVKARDPATFQQFVADATQDGPVQDVYIDAKALAQSGIVQELAQVSPAIRAQFNDAIQTGGSVRIPLDEYTANIAGTEFNQALLEHLKTDPNGMTLAESKEYAKTYQEDFNAELDKVTQEHTGDEAFKASAASVQNEILKQLNETGRYTPEVNDTNAMVAGAHFAVRAAQLGMTPEELYKLRPLKVNGESILGDSYNQDGALQTDTNNFKNWFADSKVVTPEGNPQVVYHGTTANTHEDALGFKQFLTKYFELGSHFGNTAQANSFAISDQGTGRVMPVYLNMKNPLRLQDQGGFDAMDIAPQLLNMGFIDEKQAEALQEMPIDDALVALQEAIKANGYDGIVYLNRREGMTKATLKSLMQIPFSEQNAMSDEAFKKVASDASDSYIVFDPTQIKSAVGNNGNFNPNDSNILHQAAFHGSPFRFDKFSLDHLGKGEGAQAYGWGLYFSGDKSVAEWYRKTLAGRNAGNSLTDEMSALLVDGKPLIDSFKIESDRELADFAKASNTQGALAYVEKRAARWADLANDDSYEFKSYAADKAVEWQGLERALQAGGSLTHKSTGQLYEVHIPEDSEYLHWDKPLSEQSSILDKLFEYSQSSNFGNHQLDNALSTILEAMDKGQEAKLTGRDFYDKLKYAGDTRSYWDTRPYDSSAAAEAASKYLNSIGVQGIKYLDGSSRGAGEGSHNYVIFDDKAVNIVDTFYQSTPEQKGIAELFQALTKNDDVFKYDKSTATDMQKVFDDVAPGLVKAEFAITPEGIDEQYNIYPIDKNGKVLRDQEGNINVYPDGKVEVNVLNWEEGFGGSAIYAAVGNWAFNNDKVFAGDREGITPTGKMRRLENMISLALKFGTTDHIAPHPEQMSELGFDWKTGDTNYNLEQMLQASFKALRNGTYITENRFGQSITYKSPNARGVAKLDDLVYDFDKYQFTELSSGKQFTDQQFSALAKTANARGVNGGSTTLKRAALAHTFLSAQNATERGRLLEKLSGLSRQHLVNTQLADTFYQANTNPRGSFSPSSNTITLLKNADLSTFLHELGHSFLEMDVNLAAQLAGNTQLTEGEQEILSDVGSLFNWFGLQGNINAQLDQWYAMTIEEQRTYHEKMAEGFESYLFEGKAPSIELQPLFQRMRAWFMHVYRNLSKYLSDAGETLTPEVRSVFDRMLASTEQIKLSQQARSMLPLFETADQAGMTPDEFAAYQRLDPQATQDAIAELQSRGLRDMKWLSNARAKQLKKLQKEADGLRREVRSEVTTEIMSQPVYRAWTFLTAKLSADDKLTPGIRLKSDPNIVDETQDSLFTAIAKLGGINKDAAISEWGVDPRDNPQSGVFGKPVLRKNGGLSLDAMAELLAEHSYLPVDKNGKYDIRDLEERYSEQARGNKQVSLAYDYSQDQAQIPGADINTDALKAGRLDRGALADTYGTAEGSPVAGLNTLRMTSATGLHSDIVAEMFGFSSGDQLVKALLDAQPPKQAVEDATDTRMLERHGDLSSPEALGRAADKAIHNEVRARMISTELNALAKATGKKATLASAAREFATAMIARIKVRNIKPNQYAVAEAKAAKNAAAAMRKSDLETAAAEKRNQLVNNYATKAALNARDEIDQGVKYMRKFSSDSVRKSIDVDYLDQIDAMLERFDLRTGVSLKAIDKRTALLEWMNKQRDQGLEPDIPPEFMNEALRMSYKDMSLEAFRGLVDSVKQIDHLGRLKNRLLTAKDQRTYEAVREILTTSIIENAGDRKANTRTPTTNTGRAIQGVKNFWASHIKASTWARIMDGGQDGGPVWEYFIRSANESANFETHERGTATEALSKILAPVFKIGKMGGKGQYFDSIDRSLNRESRLAIALNTGNASSYQRLLGGEGWTAQQVQPVLDSLTKAEWDAVQAIWDHFETYRPQIAAKERRVYGKEPNWVEPTAIHTAHGEYRGGYYPIKYDPNASQRAEEHVDAEGAKRQLQGAYTSATTRRSFTKTRVDEVNGRPLLYTLAGVYSGVNDVIHDLAWHEWLIDVNRLMRSSTIDSAIRDHYGPEVKRQLKSWIQDIAEGERGADNAGEMVLGKLRQGVSIAGLGFNVLSAAIQITGFNQSIVLVGAKWIGRGVTKYLASPIQSTREVTEQSEFMADRFRTQFRELNELRNSVQDQSAAKRALQDGAYFMMTRVQQMVDVPTWLGAYEKAISEGNAEERAVSLADQAVIEAQMSGMSKDLSAIERGGPALKLFTVFYSFMNTSLNLGVMKAMTEKNKAKLAADYLLLYVAGPVMGLAIKNALTPGDADDDWDFEALAKALLGESLGFLMGQMVVVREFAEAGKNAFGLPNGNYGYQGPAGVRVIADTTKFVQQAQQGEFDDAFRKASINLVGPLFGLPAAQVNRTITGINALTDGKTGNPAAAILGYQEPH